MVCFNQVVNYPIRQRLFSISDQTNLIKKDKMSTSRFPIGKSLDYEIMKSEVYMKVVIPFLLEGCVTATLQQWSCIL